MFPVGLYGILLAGLFGVTFPAALVPVESTLRTVVCLPLRAYSMIGSASPVLARESSPRFPAVLAELERSVLVAARGPSGFVPQVYRVRSRELGPLGTVDQLVLDASVDDLRHSAALVTVGGAVLGFLAPTDGVDGKAPARVRLLAYRQRRDRRDFVLRIGERLPPRRLAAQVPCEEIDAQGTLRCLVEPSRSVDPWPLRCSLLDDSYLASRLRRSGGLVTTVAQAEVPAGLAIGRLMIWGYPRRGIPVGLFVKPSIDPRAVNAVTLWRPAGSAQRSRLRPDQVGRFLPIRFSRYPAPRPAGQRWLVTSSAGAQLPDGAALVDRGRFLGRLNAPWTGQSLVTPFPASTRNWSLLLRTSKGKVIEAVAQIVATEADGRLRLELSSPSRIEAGALFTGNNGEHCPAGFFIGTASPGIGPEMLVELVDTPVLHPEVFLLGEVGLPGERDR